MEYKAVMPILGFDNIEDYTLEPVDDIFFRLTAKEAASPSFTLIRPEALRRDYVFDLPDAAAERLGLEREEDALVLNLMIVDTPLENSHVNFLAPLVFNKANGRMAQVVLDSARYPAYGLADPLRVFMNGSEEAS
ncbi:flagellar assembly protein FliW [Hydrogenimonas sp. SS33]|uniref:flagellar assembly protein FliW n=1 Tax=Hydrogenimonas leucolamina TaxID=2954236 RepID=UPI00336BC139